MGCKRILLSSDYYPALAQPNVEVVTAGSREVRAHSIVGRRRGGAAGRRHHLRHRLPADGPAARAAHPRPGGPHTGGGLAGQPAGALGTTVAGFPNLFILLGPNTGLGHNSVVFMTEAQIEHLLGALHYMRARGGGRASSREPRRSARWVAAIDRRMRGTVWMAGGLRELVPRSHRPQLHALAGLELELLPARVAVQAGRLRHDCRHGCAGLSRRGRDAARASSFPT